MRRVAITGPESTGKSWLSSLLALHYHTIYVPEFAREYLQDLARDYHQEDLLVIARRQYEAEQQGLRNARGLLFYDTDFLVLKIWHQHCYHYCPPFILDHLESKPYDLHLLCDVDLPWVFDPQREHPHLRQFFFDWYRRELEDYGFPYRVISGQGNQRLNNAIRAIDEFFPESHEIV